MPRAGRLVCPFTLASMRPIPCELWLTLLRCAALRCAALRAALGVSLHCQAIFLTNMAKAATMTANAKKAHAAARHRFQQVDMATQSESVGEAPPPRAASGKPTPPPTPASAAKAHLPAHAASPSSPSSSSSSSSVRQFHPPPRRGAPRAPGSAVSPHHVSPGPATFGVTRFSDITQEEFKKYFTKALNHAKGGRGGAVRSGRVVKDPAAAVHVATAAAAKAPAQVKNKAWHAPAQRHGLLEVSVDGPPAPPPPSKPPTQGGGGGYHNTAGTGGGGSGWVKDTFDLDSFTVRWRRMCHSHAPSSALFLPRITCVPPCVCFPLSMSCCSRCTRRRKSLPSRRCKTRHPRCRTPPPTGWLTSRSTGPASHP